MFIIQGEAYCRQHGQDAQDDRGLLAESGRGKSQAERTEREEKPSSSPCEGEAWLRR